MTSLPPMMGGSRMVIPVLLTLMLSVLVSPANAADEIRVGMLPAGGKIYTNATITRVTPAYAVVSYQAGMVQIPMSNLPAAYQTQFGYTPEKAARFLEEEKQIQKKRRAAVQSQQAALRALAGTNRPVRITAIDDNLSFGGIPFCSVDGINGGVLVENLPGSVRQFFSGYWQLQADVADCQRQLDNLKVPDPPPKSDPPPQTGKILVIGKSASFARVYAAQKDRENLVKARQDMDDRLKMLNDRLAQATTNYNLYTTIIAHPSGQSYVGKPIWVCIGIPAAAAR